MVRLLQRSSKPSGLRYSRAHAIQPLWILDDTARMVEASENDSEPAPLEPTSANLVLGMGVYSVREREKLLPLGRAIHLAPNDQR